jgi:glutaredoxin
VTDRVTVLTRAGCHLCDDACAVVAQVAGDLGIGWRATDVDADSALAAQWGEYVPVVFVDGEVHDWFRVDAARLRAALAPRAR